MILKMTFPEYVLIDKQVKKPRSTKFDKKVSLRKRGFGLYNVQK